MKVGWTSRSKKHMTASLICRPQTPAVLIAIQPIDSEKLHGVAIARGLENVILNSRKVAESNNVNEF